MKSKYFVKLPLIVPLMTVLLWGCAAPVRIVTEPPPFPDGLMSAKWGASVQDVRRAILPDGIKLFEERTDGPPYALYATGAYLNIPVTFSYFFTPKSKKLFRVDITFEGPKSYGEVRNDLIQKFKGPSFSQKGVDHWSWKDKSLVILQKDLSNVQISFSSGPFLMLNQEEGNGLLK